MRIKIIKNTTSPDDDLDISYLIGQDYEVTSKDEEGCFIKVDDLEMMIYHGEYEEVDEI